MVIYNRVDISTIKRGVIAHGVNCQGVMGSGVAAVLRREYPQIFFVYKTICTLYTKNPDWMLGLVDIVDVGGEHGEELYVVNCFTQENYGRDGKKYADAEAVKLSVDKAARFAAGLALPFYMPRIGCGLGGLSWETDVEPALEEIADKYGMNIHVCTL